MEADYYLPSLYDCQPHPTRSIAPHRGLHVYEAVSGLNPDRFRFFRFLSP